MAIKDKWLRFLIDSELAKMHNIPNLFEVGLPAPNPFLEALLPSLLYIKLGVLMEDIFEGHIMAKGLAMKKPYKDDLNGRINFLNDNGLIKDASNLHNVRKRRNELAHESQLSTWKELEDAITIVDTELQHLGLIDNRPTFEDYAERVPRKTPEAGYIVTYDYRYGLKVGGKEVAEVSYAQDISARLDARIRDYNFRIS